MAPTTPLTAVTTLIGANAGTVGRRAAVITASSGLVVSMGVTVADAAPVTSAPEAEAVTAAQPALDAAVLAALDAAASAAAVPVVQVAPDAAASLARPSLSAATPPPPPPPPPVASRSATRTAVAADASVDATEPAPAPVSVDGVRAQVLEIANRYLGIAYRYGGTTPAGFDCSGFTSYVFAQVGVDLPRTSGAQSQAGTRVTRAEALPGDLVWKPGHVGIYVGGNLMIDSPQTGDVIKVHEIRSSAVEFIRVL